MKRGTVLVLLLIATVSLFVSCQSTRNSDRESASHDGGYEEKESWTPQEGYEHLCSTKKFAFGGVGYAGVTSSGEFAFRAVLKSPHAAELFRDACIRATDEGKLYALCGLRKTDPEAYDHYVAEFHMETESVQTQSGCVIQNESMSTAVQNILDGTYDSYFTKR
jgi:hypothetical protein